MNERLKKRVQITVVAAVTLMVCLVTVLTFQLAIQGNRNRQLASLDAENARLAQQIRDAENDIGLFECPSFLEEWALRELGWGRPGQIIWRR